MGKEYPLFDFAETPKQEKEKKIPSPEKSKSLEIDSYILNLAERVKAQMGRGDGFIEASNKVFNTENINSSAKRKKIRSEIGSVLGKRGARKTQKIKKTKKLKTVPEGNTFTPAETEKMIKGAGALQEKEEERAGQTYQESGFED